MAKAKLGALNTLHESVATYFTEQLAGGDIEAKDIGNILKFLKDNDITADPSESAPVQSLVDQFKMNREELENELDSRSF